MRISALRRPCFYVRVQYSAARRQKSTLADIIARPGAEAGAARYRGSGGIGEEPEQRAVQLAEYIVEQGATVRAAAAAFGCSKSTVHKDVSVRLVRVSPGLSAQVRAVLARNKAERHLRGGAATRRKNRK